MDAIRIHTQLDSTTLTIPEIAPLVGKRVEIIVQEESPGQVKPAIRPGTGDWEAATRAIAELRDYDFDVHIEQREVDLKDMERNARMWDDAH